MACLMFLTPDRWLYDPRARRAAQAAADAGQSVLGVDVAADTGAVDGAVRLIHVRPSATTTALRRAGLGGRGPRQGTVIRELRGLYRIARTVALSIRMSRAARAAQRIDVVHANDAETLLAGVIIQRTRHARLVYDAHEIYADQEPDAPRMFRFLSRHLEAFLARRADAVLTVSGPIADELKARLRLSRRPGVVMNCPPIQSAPARSRSEHLRVIYQGAMGPGRQIADLLEMARDAEQFRLWIRVVGVDQAMLRAEIKAKGLADRVSVLDPVDPSELVSALGEFDVGLIINRPVTRNDELVLPNKLFEYLMAGLPVVAPRLPSLHAVLDAERLGATFAPGDSRDAARILNALAGEPEDLEAMSRRARDAALQRYNAETQREALLAAWGVA